MNKILLPAIFWTVFSPLICKAVDDRTKTDRDALVNELQRNGVEVQFDAANELNTIRVRSADFHAWKKIGEISDVQRLDLAGSSIDDEAIEQLAGLKQIRELYLDATEITGSSLARIGKLTTLETLSIASLHVADKDLVGIQGLKSLKRLNLGGTQVTDASIGILRQLNLNWLNLNGSKVTSSGVGKIQHALATAEIEHESIVRAIAPTPDLNANLKLTTNKPANQPAKAKPISADQPPVDHSKMKDGTPVLAQIVRTGAFVTFRNDDPQMPIQKINFFGRKIVDKSLKPLTELEVIDELTIEDTRVTNEGLRNVAKLTALKSLSISGSNVNGTALGNLSGLSGLESLVVDDLQISDAELLPLQKLTKLQTLDLGATQISDAGLENIKRWLPNLKKLKLLSNHISASSSQHFREALPTAVIDIQPYDETAFAAARPQFIAENTPEADAILERWKKRGATIDSDRENPLLVVSFEGAEFSDADLADIEQLPNLSTLTLKNRPITDEGLSHIKSLPRLSALNLSGTRITDRSLNFLTKFKHLNVLVLTGTKITDEGLKSIGKITSLHSLWLDETGVTDGGLASLKALNLERLEVPQISERGMPQISHMTKLTRLDIPNVADAGLEYLKDLKKLDILLLGSKVTDEGIMHLMPLKDNLTVLSLNRAKVTDGGLALLKDFGRLEFLFLNETSITDAAFAQLKSIPKLRRVDLEGTAVSDEAVDRYRKSLPPFRTVNR
ncbi:MAG: hypothetical protein SFV81_03370 [Pirellulaceae bacterium]|nr:hypothetical protein [Pirellulaceae bacterium]